MRTKILKIEMMPNPTPKRTLHSKGHFCALPTETAHWDDVLMGTFGINAHWDDVLMGTVLMGTFGVWFNKKKWLPVKKPPDSINREED